MLERMGTKTVIAETSAEDVDRQVAGLMRRPELLRLIGLHDVTVWRLVKLGKFPAPVHIGRAVAWRRADVANWLENLK